MKLFGKKSKLQAQDTPSAATRRSDPVSELSGLRAGYYVDHLTQLASQTIDDLHELARQAAVRRIDEFLATAMAQAKRLTADKMDHEVSEINKIVLAAVDKEVGQTIEDLKKAIAIEEKMAKKARQLLMIKEEEEARVRANGREKLLLETLEQVRQELRGREQAASEQRKHARLQREELESGQMFDMMVQRERAFIGGGDPNPKLTITAEMPLREQFRDQIWIKNQIQMVQKTALGAMGQSRDSKAVTSASLPLCGPEPDRGPNSLARLLMSMNPKEVVDAVSEGDRNFRAKIIAELPCESELFMVCTAIDRLLSGQQR